VLYNCFSLSLAVLIKLRTKYGIDSVATFAVYIVKINYLDKIVHFPKVYYQIPFPKSRLNIGTVAVLSQNPALETSLFQTLQIKIYEIWLATNGVPCT